MISDFNERGFKDDWMWHGHGTRLVLISIGFPFWGIRDYMERGTINGTPDWSVILGLFCTLLLYCGMFSYNTKYLAKIEAARGQA